MLIYLLRHGIAEDATGTQSDSERALTPEGRRKCARCSVQRRAPALLPP